jgi:hypothetical protein
MFTLILNRYKYSTVQYGVALAPSHMRVAWILREAGLELVVSANLWKLILTNESQKSPSPVEKMPLLWIPTFLVQYLSAFADDGRIAPPPSFAVLGSTVLRVRLSAHSTAASRTTFLPNRPEAYRSRFYTCTVIISWLPGR